MAREGRYGVAALTIVVALIATPGATAERPHSNAFGIWAPGAADTCPAELHDSYSVVGPDGKLYPTWHPPRVVNPETGGRCSFGHEHGRNHARSDAAEWAAEKLAAPGARGRGGIPFGLANEALVDYAAVNPGTPVRHEDHVGHKIEWQNDVELERASGGGRTQIGVTCDFLTKLHQGSHSADALGNNVHELLYAVRCDDGTRLLATKLAAFGAPNEFVRACNKTNVMGAGTTHTYPEGGGVRFIPDRACIESHVLVPGGQFSQFSRGLYEDWISSNYLRTAGGEQIAYFDPHFAVFNPSRYGYEGGTLGRVVDACWETEPNGDAARGGACDVATAGGTIPSPIPFSSVGSPFDGTHREVYFNQTTVANEDGPGRWWTDPYGGNASTEQFPGAVCQLVSRTDNTDRPALESQAFGADRPYGGRGVHSPN